MMKILKKSLFIGLLCLGACASDNEKVVKENAGKTWQLVSMSGTRASDKAIYQNFTLRIGKKQLSGKAANVFSVEAKLNADGSMQVGRVRATRMMPHGRTRFLENHYFSMLPSLTQWKKSKEKLELTGSNGKLVFAP